MEIHEFYIPSSSGLANLHCMEWIPNGEVKAVVQIAHGMMEHVGRYRESAEFLAGHGVDARSGFVQKEDIRFMDKRTAQGKLLLHAAGQCSGTTLAERFYLPVDVTH